LSGGKAKWRREIGANNHGAKNRDSGGTGAEGSGLAYRWAKAGEQVLIGSRDGARAAETAKQLRERIGGAAQIEGMDNASAAAACDVAVMTVPSPVRRHC